MALRKIEPVLAFIVGGMLCAWSEPVGMFVAFGLVTMGIKTGLDSTLLKMQNLAIRDAQIEMEIMQRGN